MNSSAFLDLLQKGITTVGVLIEAGQSAAPALEALANLISGAKAGSVTAEQLAATEALLDRLIAEFNADI